MDFSSPLSTVTPTLDGDVLAVLANHDTAFTTGQLHRILPRHSQEGIRKVLRRLVNQGIVHSVRVGSVFTYSFNRDHVAAEHIIGLATLTKTLLGRLEQRIASWGVLPEYAAVFGSAARGNMTVESDIDLLLIRPDTANDELWESQVNDLVADVSRWTGNDARVLEFSASELASRGIDEPVLRDVLQDGLTVAGNRSFLARQLRSRKV